MDLPRALADVARIQDQITKAEVYRGYRSVPVAASGVVGLAAAAVQPSEYGAGDPLGFVVYWSVVAGLAAAIGLSEILYAYVTTDSAVARRRTRRVTGQFLPAVGAAIIITVSFVHLSAALVSLLPGIWAICFGVGTFASRPFLPRASGWVGLYYYAMGVLLLWTAGGPEHLSGWSVGAVFGIGQFFASAVLYVSLEREPAGEQGS
ncbi:MAG TPA: hypothetical protein VD833_27115 [Vicinamibacterales bacterium]|nr:hypothetical protein [Vicinamibacterales bacterium]